MALKVGTPERVHIDRVIPYWRNPRHLSSEAVEAVKKSIEQYGYSQPIVVDNENVIIIGHTRYSALRRMGVEEIDIVKADHLTQYQTKQLRVIDNKAGEYSLWDFEKLSSEITGLDNELLVALFPEAAHWGEGAGTSYEVTEEETSGDGRHTDWQDVIPSVEFVCPSCYHEWETVVNREDVMNGRIGQKPGEVQA